MICRICNRDLEIPSNAIELRRRFRLALYQLPEDKQVHEFRIEKVRAEKKTPAQKV
jgi:hypothetical protein